MTTIDQARHAPHPIVVVHNTLWAHYKGVVFSELHKLLLEKGNHQSLVVIHQTETESNRVGLGPIDQLLHDYPHIVVSKGDVKAPVRDSIVTLRAINAIRPDVIVVSGYFLTTYWAVLIYGLMRRIPVVVTIDSTLNDRHQGKVKVVLKRLFCRFVDGALVYGERAKKYAEFLGVPSSRIFVRCQAAPNEILRSLWQRARAEVGERKACLGVRARYNFLYVGRLAPEKNLRLLVKSFMQLRARCKAAQEWGLIFLGTGPMRDELVAEKRDRDIVIADGVPWREVPLYMAMSDVLVLPSVSEPWGLVVNEAMVCELPVIVSERCGCVPELVSPNNGRTFDPFDPESLVSAMEMMVGKSEEARAAMGRAGWAIVREFSPRNAASNMYEGIRRIIRREDT